MEDTYRTIEKPAEGIYRDRNSRFLAFGYPVETTDQVHEILGTLKKKYHDARHHCYAYRIGPGPYQYRTNDDGEPSGTAGKPIYGQILSHGLTNILIVVVRYFGGTLLGTSGLINAYRTAAASMLDEAVIIEKTIGITCNLSFPYALLNGVMKVIKEEGVAYTNPSYDNSCNLTVSIPKSILEKFRGKLVLLEKVVCTEISEDPAGQLNPFQ